MDAARDWLQLPEGSAGAVAGIGKTKVLQQVVDRHHRQPAVGESVACGGVAASCQCTAAVVSAHCPGTVRMIALTSRAIKSSVIFCVLT